MEELNSSGAMPPEERARIVRAFEARLDQFLDQAQEPMPPGLTAELIAALENGDPLPLLESGETDGCDLYSLWAAMTALTQEVRLQGRTFKQLHQTLNQSLEATAASADDAVTEQFRDQVQQPRKQEIDLLLDLRDRIERGGRTAQNAAEELAPARLSWLQRLGYRLGLGAGYARHTQEILAALSHGYSLTLASLDEALLACRISRIADRLFDPQRMTAVEMEETSAVPEGTVLEVYRNGYEWNSEVYRTAQVKVARNPRGKSE
jgi:molecular chaperone GrpE (heat shock protein)